VPVGSHDRPTGKPFHYVVSGAVDCGNEIENNALSHNGFFGNPSNVDLAELSNLAYPGNCWHGNVDTSGKAISSKHFQLGRPGRVTSDPLFIQYFPPQHLRNPVRGHGAH
jgi:hypothetical protein